MTQIKQFSSTTVLEAIADALPTSALQTLEFHVATLNWFWYHNKY